MPAIAALNLYETTISTGTVAMNPQGLDSQNIAKWLESAAASYAGARVLTIQTKLPKSGGSVARVTGKVAYPLVDALTPPTKLAEGYCQFEFVLPTIMTATQRAKLYFNALSAMNLANVANAVAYLESSY